MKRLLMFAAGLALSGSVLAQAQHQAKGTVTRVDREKARLTIKHDPVPSLKWPGMTMGFAVKDKAMLEKAKPGTEIQFSFMQSGREYVITEIK
jgi:Cu/Ag efflux protein CusF